MTYSKNVAVYPLNVEGALELELHPCQFCNSGWATYSSSNKYESCQHDCSWLNRYNNMKRSKAQDGNSRNPK